MVVSFETCYPNAVKHWPPVKNRLSTANGRIVSEIIRQKKCKKVESNQYYSIAKSFEEIWSIEHFHWFNCLRMSWQNGVFWPQGSLLFGVQKRSLQDCPKILLHLYEEDTLFFSSIGKLWLKAVYQVVSFASQICQFYVCQKSVKWIKLLKIQKMLDFPSNRKISHRNYYLSCVLSIKIFCRYRVCHFFNF